MMSHSTPHPPRNIPSGISPEIQDLIMRPLAFEPEGERYRDLAERISRYQTRLSSAPASLPKEIKANIKLSKAIEVLERKQLIEFVNVYDSLKHPLPEKSPPMLEESKAYISYRQPTPKRSLRAKPKRSLRAEPTVSLPRVIEHAGVSLAFHALSFSFSPPKNNNKEQKDVGPFI
jgi:hypothetical protein